MARFSERQLDEIRQRVDIVDIVGRHVKLKRAGRNWLGLCPFHQERTPSFSVRQDRQYFHCFGCKEGGDLFSFVMKIEGLEFPEAVERLAAEAGIQLEREEVTPAVHQRRSEKERLFEVNRLAADYFAQQLQSVAGRTARQYLARRGIDRTVAERYALGYAPGGWRALLEHMRDQGVRPEELVRVGLAVQRDERPPFDLFRHRLIFPIHDVRGRIVGFGGRALAPDERAKYINTPQTELFSKGEHLYGLYLAREAARRARRIVLCEGYTDVTALAQAGIGEAAASLGTAFTAEQAALLRRWVDEVVLAFDADGAGRTAAEQGVDLLAEAGLRVRVILLPEGEDPDSYVRKHGPNGFRQLLQQALSLTEYKIEEAFRVGDVNDIDGRLAIAKAVVPVLSSLESPVALEAYTARVAQRLAVSESALLAELQRYEGENSRLRNSRHRIVSSRHTKTDSAKSTFRGSNVGDARRTKGEGGELSPSPGLVQDERTLLYLITQSPDRIERVESVLGPHPFVVERHNRLYHAVKEGVHSSGASHTATNLSPGDAKVLERLAEWKPLVALDFDIYLRRVWERRMAHRLRILEAQLARLSERDENAYADRVGSLLQQYKQLRQAVRTGFDRRVG